MITVNPRAHRHQDRAGDPLDGLVNLFDVGIVLAVAFLLAALSSLNLTRSITKNGLHKPNDVITAPNSAAVSTLPPTGARTVGRGVRVGTVYRLPDGRLIYVLPSGTPTPHTGPVTDAGLVVSYFSDGLAEAWHLIISRDPYLQELAWNSLKVAAIPAAIAGVVGLPLGIALGIGRFRGRGILRAIANAGLGLPPVVVGLVLILLFLPLSPLGGLHLAFTMRGVYIGQTILDLPVITALTSAAVAGVPTPLLDQARAFGARRHRVAALAAREAKVGIVAAFIAAIGSGLSEVGIVVLVGGNIEQFDQTLASAALEKADAADFGTGLAIAIVLIGMIVIVLGLLTWLQYRSGRFLPFKQAS